MSRRWNFSAGPAAIPESVLARAQEQFLEFADFGASVMEVSHRSAGFMALAERIEADLRALLEVPEHYKVVFLQGGATLQFSGVANNLLAQDDTLAFVDTGHWSQKAFSIAGQHCKAVWAARGENCVPDSAHWNIPTAAKALHITPNETIHGVEYASDAPPQELVGDRILIADMSSNILSRPLDVSRFGVIYAGAQKNIGPAGLTLVLVREDLLGRCRPHWPDVLNYAKQASRESMLNTPPSFAWYLAGLVFEWVREQGGLEAMAVRNQAKASTLYGAIAASDFYRCDVAEGSRSRMNVVFHIHDQSLEPVFVREASDAGLLALKGHSALGGLRASLYNAMPQAGVEALVSFMRDFAQRYG